MQMMELATRGRAAIGAVDVSLLCLTRICITEIAHPQLQSHKKSARRNTDRPQKAGDSWDFKSTDSLAVLPPHFPVPMA